MRIRFGPGTCGSLDEASRREWLVTDGLGGFAMGTVAGLATRRYHGLLVAATDPPRGRFLALASLDPVLVMGDRRIRLATHAWAGGSVEPRGHELLIGFDLDDGLPRWRWQVGEVVVERELAMLHGRPCVAVVHRVVRAPRPVRLELDALCTWRDAHGERGAWGDPEIWVVEGGFVFEGRYRVRGDGFEPDGSWYRGWRHPEEAARGLADTEDLVHAGRFGVDLDPGGHIGVVAWADDPSDAPPPADLIVEGERARARRVVERAGGRDTGDVEGRLALAAEAFVVAGPTVVAGYPWFGDWSRDTMTSYEGLFLATGRVDEGRALLERMAATLSEGMLANTADAGGTEYNTVDGTLWFLHAVGRHVEVAGDDDLAAALAPAFEEVVRHHVEGTRFGIRVDPADGLLTQGAPGWALTWMDARVDGEPVTPRHGKPVEVNALWVSGLAHVGRLLARAGGDADAVRSLEERARASFRERFVRADGRGLFDVVDGPDGDDPSVRPNQLLAASLPHGPLADPGGAGNVVAAVEPLVTPVGLRSLSPGDGRYLGRHRGGPVERDRAYHQGTVWPWLIGPYVAAAVAAGRADPGMLDPLEAHLADAGLGSVSETADADAPHGTTGCPFQAWSVAELIRARALLRASGG